MKRRPQKSRVEKSSYLRIPLTIAVCLILLLFGCRIFSIEIAEEATPEPPPTPTLCTPLPEGMTFQVMPLGSTSLEIIMTGLQTGEIPLVTVEGETADGSIHAELSSTQPVDASGQYHFTVTDLNLTPPPPYWTVLVTHARGVACTSVSLP